MESKNKYHTVGIVPKPNRNIVQHRLNRYPYDTYTWPLTKEKTHKTQTQKRKQRINKITTQSKINKQKNN
jgi:hypothetical protein